MVFTTENAIDVNKTSKSITQADMLKKEFGISPEQVQKNLTDMNTRLLIIIQFSRQSIEEQVLDQWNILMNKYLEFMKRVYFDVQQELRVNETIAQGHRGEYDDLVPKYDRLLQLDQQMQSIHFSLCFDQIAYKDNAVVLKSELLELQTTMFMDAYQSSSQMLEETRKLWNRHWQKLQPQTDSSPRFHRIPRR